MNLEYINYKINLIQNKSLLKYMILYIRFNPNCKNLKKSIL